MLDNALIAVLIRAVVAGEQSAGIPGTPVAQAFQPVQQGVDTGPTAYLHKVGDRRYGFPRRSDVWDPASGRMVHTELQKYETTFQFSALSAQNPATPQQYTASDVVNLIAHILQSDATVAALEAQGVGLLRVTDVRNPYFLDDRGRFESSPSFDVTVTHDQIIATTTPIAQSVEARVERV